MLRSYPYFESSPILDLINFQYVSDMTQYSVGMFNFEGCSCTLTYRYISSYDVYISVVQGSCTVEISKPQNYVSQAAIFSFCGSDVRFFFGWHTCLYWALITLDVFSPKASCNFMKISAKPTYLINMCFFL